MESPNTLICFTLILSAIVNLVRYASYLATLLEQEKPSLKDKGMVSPFSQLSMTPTPFEVVVADPSNLVVHFFHGSLSSPFHLGSLHSVSFLPFLGTELADLLWLGF